MYLLTDWTIRSQVKLVVSGCCCCFGCSGFLLFFRCFEDNSVFLLCLVFSHEFARFALSGVIRASPFFLVTTIGSDAPKHNGKPKKPGFGAIISYNWYICWANKRSCWRIHAHAVKLCTHNDAQGLLSC